MKLLKIIKSNKGAMYIEMIVATFVVMLLFVLLLKIMPVLILRSEIGACAKYISRIVSVEGCYNTEVINKIESYKTANNLTNIVISFDETEYISGTNKIQLSDQIMVKVITSYDLGFFTFGSFPVELSAKSITRSEVYWKTFGD